MDDLFWVGIIVVILGLVWRVRALNTPWGRLTRSAGAVLVILGIILVAFSMVL